MLYIANKSPFERPLPTAGDNTSLLLIGNAVTAAVLADSAPLDGYAHVYVLSDDLAARGLADRLNDKATAIDYDRFVSLTLEHSPVVSW